MVVACWIRWVGIKIKHWFLNMDCLTHTGLWALHCTVWNRQYLLYNHLFLPFFSLLPLTSNFSHILEKDIKLKHILSQIYLLTWVLTYHVCTMPLYLCLLIKRRLGILIPMTKKVDKQDTKIMTHKTLNSWFQN